MRFSARLVFCACWFAGVLLLTQRPPIAVATVWCERPNGLPAEFTHLFDEVRDFSGCSAAMEAWQLYLGEEVNRPDAVVELERKLIFEIMVLEGAIQKVRMIPSVMRSVKLAALLARRPQYRSMKLEISRLATDLLEVHQERINSYADLILIILNRDMAGTADASEAIWLLKQIFELKKAAAVIEFEDDCKLVNKNKDIDHTPSAGSHSQHLIADLQNQWQSAAIQLKAHKSLGMWLRIVGKSEF